MKRLDQILNIVIMVFLGIFVKYAVDTYWAYQAQPGLYEAQSAPWYTGVLTDGLFTGVVLAAAVILKLVICKKGKGEG